MMQVLKQLPYSSKACLSMPRRRLSGSPQVVKVAVIRNTPATSFVRRFGTDRG
jgi:hypothetical protein